jgi:hypothetical protein
LLINCKIPLSLKYNFLLWISNMFYTYQNV